MKTLLTAIVVACGALLPVTSVQAAGKKFGNFNADYTFSMKISSVTKINTNGKDSPLIPKYRKGDSIKFKISPTGQLKLVGTKHTVKFDKVNTVAPLHEFANPFVLGKLNANARFTKQKNKKPTVGDITFSHQFLTSPYSNHQVTYTF